MKIHHHLPLALLSALLLAMTACVPTLKPVSLSQQSTDQIEAYLVRNIGISGFGGEVFCPFDVLGQDSGGTKLYVWTLCAEYQLVGNELEMGTASSLPVSLTMERQGESLQVTGHQTPPEGWSAGALEKIFPAAIIERFCMQAPDCYNERAARLQQQAEQAARDFYKINP